MQEVDAKQQKQNLTSNKYLNRFSKTYCGFIHIFSNRKMFYSRFGEIRRVRLLTAKLEEKRKHQNGNLEQHESKRKILILNKSKSIVITSQSF